MVLLGLHLTGTMPFKEVLCHGMVSDCYGRKMGKSLGNGVDPLDVIQGKTLEALHKKLREGDWEEWQIEKVKAGQKRDFPNGVPQCGADALRFALCSYAEGGAYLLRFFFWTDHELKFFRSTHQCSNPAC
jgi:valyl-tRNA synthetase